MRRAGVLLHPTSLPSPGPCGDLGEAAIHFLDWLAEAGCSLWQTLPLNPVGGDFSPYDSPSTFAAATHLISVDRLLLDGLLTINEIGTRPQNTAAVDVDALYQWHAPLVELAASRLAREDGAALETFTAHNPWAEDWALFEAIRRDLGVKGWWGFPEPLINREADALEHAREQYREAMQVHLAAQLVYQRQWSTIRDAARLRGIEIIGDLPIFVNREGCDTWSNRDLFRWKADEWRPDPVSGAPPDNFTVLGQIWNNAMYNWPTHQADDFAWWVRRFQAALAQVDKLRVDHFRGFAAAWEIPADAPDARGGKWGPTPGRELFAAVMKTIGSVPIIAEDLGVITPDVVELRESLNVPGMKVIQFAFGADATHSDLPHNFENALCVAYTGTHDTDTAAGWYAQAPDPARHRYRVYTGRDGQEPGWDLVRLAWSSIAQWAIAPLQDVLNLGGDARMNTPGTMYGNWRWRTTALPAEAARRLAQMGWAYGR